MGVVVELPKIAHMINPLGHQSRVLCVSDSPISSILEVRVNDTPISAKHTASNRNAISATQRDTFLFSASALGFSYFLLCLNGSFGKSSASITFNTIVL